MSQARKNRLTGLPARHSQDSDCTLDPMTNCCRECCVFHGEPCEECRGRGFHRPGCLPSEDPDAYHNHAAHRVVTFAMHGNRVPLPLAQEARDAFEIVRDDRDTFRAELDQARKDISSLEGDRDVEILRAADAEAQRDALAEALRAFEAAYDEYTSDETGDVDLDRLGDASVKARAALDGAK